VYDLRVGFFFAVIAAIDVEAGRGEMGKARSQSEALGSRRRHETVKLRHARGIEGIQDPAEGVIVELCGGNAGRNTPVGGLMLEEPRDQGECVIDQSQAIEHHGFDGFTHGEVPPCRVLVGRLIEDIAKTEFVEHASDKAEVVQNLATVVGESGITISSESEESVKDLQRNTKMTHIAEGGAESRIGSPQTSDSPDLVVKFQPMDIVDDILQQFLVSPLFL
jgi:hypothetical protein